MNITIDKITWQDAMPIRHQVLWANKPIEHCQVEGDEEAEHFGAFVDNVLVGRRRYTEMTIKLDCVSWPSCLSIKGRVLVRP